MLRNVSAHHARTAQYREVARHLGVAMLLVPLAGVGWLLDQRAFDDGQIVYAALLFFAFPFVHAVVLLGRRTRMLTLAKLFDRSFPTSSLGFSIAMTVATAIVLTVVIATRGASRSVFFLAFFCDSVYWTIGTVQEWYARLAFAAETDSSRSLFALVQIRAAAGQTEGSSSLLAFDADGEMLDLISRAAATLHVSSIWLRAGRLEAMCEPMSRRELLRTCALLRLEGYRIVGARGDPSPLFVDGAVLHARR